MLQRSTLWLVVLLQLGFHSPASAWCTPPIIEQFSVTDNSGVPSDNAVCHNDIINFGVQIAYGSGTPPYQYAWTSSVNTGVTINNPNDPYTAVFYQNTTNAVVTTTMTLVVTDAVGCTATQSVDIDMNPHLTAEVAYYENSGTPNDGGICYGDQMTFDVDMNVSGSYTYAWDAGWTEEIVTFSPPYNNSTSFYYVTVTNDAGCTATGFEIAKGYTDIVSSITYVPGCEPGDPDAIEFEVSGGNPTASGYFFQLNMAPPQWQQSPWQVNIPGSMPPGSLIDSLIKDEKGCREPVSFILPDHPGYLDATEMVTESGCDPTGAIDQTVNGGTPPYSFLWSNDVTSEDLNNIPPGTYYCTITDDLGCTFVNEAVVGHDPEGEGCELLPVELTYFTATYKKQSVSLSWQTASEINNQGFEVWTSTDGSYFHRLGFVSGAGTSVEVHNYTFEHTSPVAGMNYYKLKQLDWNGQAAVSEVIAFRVEADPVISVYPNPASKEGVLHLKQHLTDAKKQDISLINARGRTVWQKRLVLEKGSQLIDLPLEGVPSGFYYLQIVGENKGLQTVKVLIK